MTQAQPDLLELAKQGNAKALTKRGAIAHIFALINRQLQPKGITVRGSLRDGCLRVMLKTAHI